MSISVELPDVAAGTNSDAVRIGRIVRGVTSGQRSEPSRTPTAVVLFGRAG